MRREPIIRGVVVLVAAAAAAFLLLPSRQDAVRGQRGGGSRVEASKLSAPGTTARARGAAGGVERGVEPAASDPLTSPLPAPAPAPIEGAFAAVARLLASDPSLEVAFAGGLPRVTSIAGILGPADPRDPETVAREFLRRNAGLFGIRDVDRELDYDDARSKHDAETGWSLARFDQVLSGIPVDGRALGVNVDADGRVRAAHGQFAPGLDPASIAPSPTVDAAGVEAAVRADLPAGAALDVFTAPTLAVAVAPSGPVLAWRTEVVSAASGFGAVYLIDATTAAVVERQSTVCSYGLTLGGTSGSGTDSWGNTRSLSLARYAFNGVPFGDYYLEDLSRTADILGYNHDGATWSAWDVSGILTDSNSTWSGERTYQGAEVAGQYNLALILDWFSTYCSRSSYDGSGTDLHVGYHAGSATNNAASLGSGYLVFGDGSSSRMPFTGLDVCAHEFGHEFVRYEGVDYSGDEPKAIHESMGDVFGCLVERAYGNTTSGSANFQLGEDTYSGASSSIRDLSSPSRDHYTEFVSSGDAHTNGEILNYAAYLIWQGGTHPDSTVSVSGQGSTVTRKIYYKAVNEYLSGNSSPSYYDARIACSSAASEVYGSSSSERTAVQDAFTSVGVTTKNFDFIDYANDFDTWECGGSSVPFNSPNVWPGVWYPKYELEDGTAAPTSYGEQLAMLPGEGAYSQLKGAFPIWIPTVSGSSEPRLRVSVGFKDRDVYVTSSCYEAWVGVYFVPSDGSGNFTWWTEITYDGTMDTANENLSSWAGKTGTMYVWVMNEGDKVDGTIVWDRCEISYE